MMTMTIIMMVMMTLDQSDEETHNMTNPKTQKKAMTKTITIPFRKHLKEQPRDHLGHFTWQLRTTITVSLQ